MWRLGERMKIRVLVQTIVICVIVGSLSGLIYGVCNNRDNQHKDQKTVRCWYTQKDLARIRQKDSERYKEMGLAENACFYCGCELQEHTQE